MTQCPRRTALVRFLLLLSSTALWVSVAEVAAASPPKIVAVGDIACQSFSQSDGEGACRSDEVAALITSLRPDAFLALGDLQYNDGGLDQFLRVYDRAVRASQPDHLPGARKPRVRNARRAGLLRLLRIARARSGRLLLVQPRHLAHRGVELRHLS